MNTKSFILSGIVGSIVSFLLGFLFYGLIFTDLHPEGTESSMLFIFLGCLFYAFAFALIFSHWAQICTFNTWAKAGFFIGLLWSLSMIFFMNSSDGVLDYYNTVIMVAVDAISAAVMGGMIASVVGKLTTKSL